MSLIKRLQEAEIFKAPSEEEGLDRKGVKREVEYCPNCDILDVTLDPETKKCIMCDKDTQKVALNTKQRSMLDKINKYEDEAMAAEISMDSISARDPYPGQEKQFKSAYSSRYKRMEASRKEAEKLADQLRKELNLKKVSEAGTTVVEPETEPATKPDTAPAPTKTPSPLKPTPGITPKPKAKRDIDLFAKARKGIAEQHIAHPDKVEWILKGDPTINKLLPKLSDEEETYLMQIASDEYQDLVAKIEKYTGEKVEQSTLPSLYQLLIQSLEKAIKLEGTNKKYFEEWAVMLPLELEEFKTVEESVVNGDLKIDARLDEPDLSQHLSDEPKDEGLSPAEDINLAMMKELEDTTETAIQRRFANLLTAGGSSSKLYLFNLMKEKLEGIDKSLPNVYGILASLAQLGYWVSPEGVEKAAAGGEQKAGSVQLVPDGENYIIKARATTFPYLVHEVVKGIYEYLALNKEHEPEMGAETLDTETKDMLAGPGVYKKFISYVPYEKHKLLPLIQKFAIKRPAEDIQAVLSGSDKGKRIMKDLINQAEESWDVYQRSKA